MSAGAASEDPQVRLVAYEPLEEALGVFAVDERLLDLSAGDGHDERPGPIQGPGADAIPSRGELTAERRHQTYPGCSKEHGATCVARWPRQGTP
jgi:hypothetical protein